MCIHRLTKNIDILVHPFQRYEGETFCLANVEAFMKGTFVLAPSIGGMHDYLHEIQRRVNAFVETKLKGEHFDVTMVDTTEPSAIAKQVAALLTSKHFQAIRKISQHFVQNTFTTRKQIKAYASIYKG